MLILVCAAILVVQLVYLTIFLYQFLKKKEETVPADPVPVSIIICAHDEEVNLRELLPLLLTQHYPSFEIIVVEDRCNDGTYDYLRELGEANPLVRAVHVTQIPPHVNAKKFGLTLGIRAAKHDIILLTDADCRPVGADWVSGMLAGFTSGKQIVIGYSGYEESQGLLNAFIRFETLVTGIQYIGLAWAGMPYMGVGRNLAYRKALFLDNKGFNDQLGITGGDDDLFVNKYASNTNTHVAAGERTLICSKPKTTLRAFYYQKVRHLSVGKKYKPATKVVLGLFMLSWMLTWLFALPAGFMTPYYYVVPGLIVVRWILMGWLVQVGSRQLGDPFKGWKTPFLEFIYVFYYLVAGTVALLSKKVRWKI